MAAEHEMYRLDLVIGTRGVDLVERQMRNIDRMIQQTQRRASALNRTRINPTVRITDQSTSSTRRITSSLNRIDRTVARPEVRVRDVATAKLNKVSSMLGGLTGRAFSITLSTAFTGAAMLTGAAAYAGLKSTEKAMAFENQMKSIQALTQISDQALTSMTNLALKEGARTKYSALEAAQGIEELLKAGISPAKVESGALAAALNLATAGGMGMADAAALMSTSLNAYKKDALTASQASDILAGTANASAVDLTDLKFALSMVGAVADGVGQTFSDTNAALGVLGNNGLKGSDAGTSLKTFLLNTVPQTEKAYNLFEQFGFMTVNTTKAMSALSKAGIKPVSDSVTDVSKAFEILVAKQTGFKKGTTKLTKATHDYLTANGLVHSAFYTNEGDFKDIASVADLLRNNLKKLNGEQRQYYLKQMFGTDAIRAANILYKEGAAGLKDFTKEMTNVTALKVAKDKMNSASGAVEQFRGALETLQISALIPTMPIIQKVVNAFAEGMAALSPQLNEAMSRFSKKAENYIDTHFLNNPEFKNLDLEGKVHFIIDDFKGQLENWWNTTGQQAVVNIAEKIGSGLGSSAKGVIMGALGILDDGDDSIYVSAGESAGSAFFQAFLDAFDAGAIAKKAAEALSSSNINAIQNPTAGNITSAVTSDLLTLAAGGWILGKAKSVLKSVPGVKKGAGKLKRIFGKGTSAAGGTEGTIIAGESAARGAATGAGSVAEGAASAANKTVRNPTGSPVNRPVIDRFDPRYRPGNKVTVKAIEMPGVKIAAKAAVPLMVAADAYSIANAEPGRDRAEKIGSSAGGWAGAWAGATAGGAIGSVIPGPGTVIGGIIGGIGGGFGGSWVGKGSAGKFMDAVYGKKVQAPEVDSVLGGSSGVDAVLGQKPAATRVVNNSSTTSIAAPAVKDIVSQTLAAIAAKGNGSKSNETSTVRISPEQVNGMENGIRNIKADTTNQFNITLPPGTVQVVVQGTEIGDDVIESVSNQVGSKLAAEMRAKTQNLK
ncbi:phage tail tape measure protein [Paenibacillus sp. HN-1]|uniref:phage tail tape measure protein n=1 Tax=Paenibacillus TaxID=44249 RepID=UPI001CA89ADD|nr:MULTISPECIES: phage tail tape measure protein [Paenibacillus]MBY9080993.1 phage tail tape measure protein [Paenibacillus sp. CGMCC 1.18879]MBY9084095.1 phage tail tape measure protein [Paenibacillus sinensis]